MSNVQPCPKCFRLVSLPDESDTSVWVRCPLCGEEYQLQDALDFKPPALELVSEGLASIPITAADRSIDKGDEIDHSIDEIAEPNRAVLEGIPFDPDLPDKADELDTVSTSHEPAMMHTDEDPLDAILEEALYDDSGKSAESTFAKMPEQAAEEKTGEVVEPEPWDISAPDSEEPLAHTEHSDFQGEHAVMHEDELQMEAAHQRAPEPFLPHDENAPEDRPIKNQKGLASELVKIVAGGLVGLLVAYAVLFWAFKIDLLGVAKMLPASIVPDKLKSTSAIAARPAPSTEVAQNNSPDPPTQADGESPPVTPAADTPTDTAAPPPDGALSNTLTMPADAASSSTPSGMPQPQTAASDLSGPAATAPVADAASSSVPTPNTSAPSETVPTPDPFGTTANFPPIPTATAPPAAEPEGPKSTKTVSLADVSQAIEAAKSSVAAYADAAPSAVTDLRKTYYQNLAKLAEGISLLKPQAGDDHDQTLRSAAAALISDIATDRAKLEELGYLAGYWIDATRRIQDGVDGIALAGTVEAVEPIGKHFRTQVRLFKAGRTNAKEMAVPVITAEKPNLANGDAAVVLGEVVKDPSQNLYHYDGSDDRVVWAAVLIPAPQTR